MTRTPAKLPRRGAALVAIALLLLLVGAGPAQAASPAPAIWSVAPATPTGPDGERGRFEFSDLAPGDTVTDLVAVQNRGETGLSLLVYASDARNTADGGFDLLPADEAPTGVGAWVRVENEEIVLGPGEQTVVPFTLTVPENATPGEHVGGIVAALVVPSTGSDGAVIDVHYRVGARIYLRVDGPLEPRLEIEDVTARYEGGLNPLELGDLQVGWTVRNTGNVRLGGTHAVRVTAPLGITLATQRLDDLPELLPGASLDLAHTSPDLLPLLLLGARVELQPIAPEELALSALPAVTGAADAWAIPWLLLPVLVLLIILGARRWRRRRARGTVAPSAATAASLLVAMALAVTACGPATPASEGDDRLSVEVTHEILADLVRAVAGDRADVASIIPPGGDPHTYEPTQADARRLAEADVAFTNHLLLEEHTLIKLFDTIVPAGTPNIAVAEAAERYGARLLPMEENVGLDVPWLGIAVRSDPGNGQLSRAADVILRASHLEGPGDLRVYVTDGLGVPRIYIDSADGLGADDRVILPPGAHTHVNWAFSEMGWYRLTMEALVEDEGRIEPVGTGTFRFAVGVDPTTGTKPADLVVREGHVDLGVDLGRGTLFGCADAGSCAEAGTAVAAERVVVEVPDRARVAVPDAPAFAFLGAPGSASWELPQAVLGRHVHGTIDPHAWHDVGNVRAFVQVIADTLIDADPAGRSAYEANRDAYLETLAALNQEVAARIATIPPANRALVTTHDAFGYLAAAYGLEIGGFVVPNPGQQPSVTQVERLTMTIRELEVPAVFVEPNLHARGSVLRQVAHDEGVEVCVLYGDAFGGAVRSYVDLMRHNANELARCLGADR